MTPDGVACPGATTISSGISTPAISTNGVFDDTKMAGAPPIGINYSLSERFSLTLAPNEELNFSTSSIVSTIPEPATIPLLGTGLILLGALGRKRLLTNK
jgi:hypothetical protein